MKRLAEAGIPILLIAIGVLVGLRHVPGFGITEIVWEGSPAPTLMMEKAARGAEGENRFLVDTGEIEEELRALPYIGKADVTVKGHTLTVRTERREGILLVGPERVLFTDGNAVSRLREGDAGSLSEEYLKLTLEPGRAAYVEEFGLGPEFQRVTALMLELSGGLCYNHDLISTGSYTASDGPGFGTLTLESDVLGTTVLIREELSGEYLSSLILSLGEKGPSEGFRHQTYEIKDNTLKMRKEG